MRCLARMPLDRAMSSPPSKPDPEQVAEALAVLLARVGTNRDRDAFVALFSYFAPRLKSFYLRRGADSGAAEDLAQETMLRIWHHAAQFNPSRATPAAWVFGIARNLRADTLRRQRNRLPEFDLPEPYAPEDSPEAAAMHAQQESRLRAALHDLPGPQQDAVRVAFLNGLPHGEAHRALGIALGTLKSRLRLALARLRVILDEPP
jgi:RNA polymerase sigma-70 factor (ECF subfamily)